MKTKNNIWLFYLRVSVAVIALMGFLSLQFDFYELYGEDGLIKPEILSATMDGLSPTIYDIYIILSNNIGLSYYQVLNFFRYGFIISLVMLSLGLATRISASLALIFQIILIKSIHYYQYGFDFFITILLFYCIILPVGKIFSLDNKILKRKNKVSNVNYLSLLQIHICIVYFFGGFGKALGISWFNGEAIWKTVTAYNNLGWVNLDNFQVPILFIVTGWIVVALELLYPIFINIKKTRLIWLSLIIGMHISIAFVMGLFFFSAIMIIFNLITYYIPYLREKENLPTKKFILN
jgi:hypothetical protein